MKGLQEKLGYEFAQTDLLRQALTHSSYGNENHLPSYQRLEFLGDSVLGVLVAEYLYHKYPNLPEGELTRRRAALVCEDALVVVAKNLHLGKEISLGRGEKPFGAKPSILADVVEAILAAVYLDGGMSAARDMVDRLVLPLEGKESVSSTDYKSALQEHLQKDGAQQISYELVSSSGPDHLKEFQVAVVVNGVSKGRGTGKSKKEAEQQAAKIAYLSLKGKKKEA